MDVLEVGVRNLTQRVTHALGRAIVQGHYDQSGGLPTEAELSAEFDTSRSVTREAVKMLTAKGLIASRPRQGIKIQPKNAWNLFDSDVLTWLAGARLSSSLLEEFAQLRGAIEPAAAALAARLGNGEKIQALGVAVLALEALTADADSGLCLSAEAAFHTAILAASGNRFFGQFGDFIQTALGAASALHPQGKRLDIRSYRLVYEAIVAGRQQEARGAMSALLEIPLEARKVTGEELVLS